MFIDLLNYISVKPLKATLNGSCTKHEELDLSDVKNLYVSLGSIEMFTVSTGFNSENLTIEVHTPSRVIRLIYQAKDLQAADLNIKKVVAHFNKVKKAINPFADS